MSDENIQAAAPVAPPAGMGPRKTNGLALASLIFGLLGCVPLITGLLAVILGFVGLRKTRDPMVGGKGLAIAGILLGLASFVAWSVFGAATYLFFEQSAPAREAGRQFVTDIVSGDIDAAVAASVEGTSRETLETASQRVQKWGPLQDVSYDSVDVATRNGVSRCDLKGVATFVNAPAKAFTLGLIKQNETYKVAEFTFEPDP